MGCSDRPKKGIPSQASKGPSTGREGTGGPNELSPANKRFETGEKGAPGQGQRESKEPTPLVPEEKIWPAL